MSETRELIEKWFEKNAPLCTCDEAYTGRGLTAPDCLRHRGLDAEDLIRMLKELGLAALAERAERPSEEERKAGLTALDNLCASKSMREGGFFVHEVRDYNMVRALILGSRGGVSEEEKGLMIKHLKNLAWASHHGPIELCPNCHKLRALILGNQGGAVSPDTQVSPCGETSGAVKEGWIKETARTMTNAADLLGKLSTEELLALGEGNENYLRRRLREAGAAGKEKKDETKG
jgi:sulfur relay (sulfurtransferase) complex TusBCD TusD component (DsrE family)